MWYDRNDNIFIVVYMLLYSSLLCSLSIVFISIHVGTFYVIFFVVDFYVVRRVTRMAENVWIFFLPFAFSLFSIYNMWSNLNVLLCVCIENSKYMCLDVRDRIFFLFLSLPFFHFYCAGLFVYLLCSTKVSSNRKTHLNTRNEDNKWSDDVCRFYSTNIRITALR